MGRSEPQVQGAPHVLVAKHTCWWSAMVRPGYAHHTHHTHPPHPPTTPTPT